MLTPLGVTIEKGEKIELYSLQSDADVYTTIDNKFYLGLAKNTAIRVGPNKPKFHIVRSNVPFTLTSEGDRHQLSLESAGMQQVKIFSPNRAHFRYIYGQHRL